jgi:hypothetical protein
MWDRLLAKYGHKIVVDGLGDPAIPVEIEDN